MSQEFGAQVQVPEDVVKTAPESALGIALRNQGGLMRVLSRCPRALPAAPRFLRALPRARSEALLEGSQSFGPLGPLADRQTLNTCPPPTFK